MSASAQRRYYAKHKAECDRRAKRARDPERHRAYMRAYMKKRRAQARGQKPS